MPGLLGRGRCGAALRPEVVLGVLWGAAVACAPAPDWQPPGAPPPPSERQTERLAERRIADARAFLAQQRPEAAERSARRALETSRDHPEAHRILARALEAQGREAEARAHRERAASLAPGPPPPPEAPLPVDSRGVVVLLLADAAERGGGTGSRRRPDPAEAERVVRSHLARRLPEARVVEPRADPESAAAARARLAALAARAALALGVERGFCDWSQKEGAFAVGWLRVAAATPAGLTGPPTTVRRVLDAPPPGSGCVERVLVHALEKALSRPEVQRALEAPRGPGVWPSPALRALFPGLERRVAHHVAEGRRALATGRVEAAAEAFRAALAVDPEDGEARTYLREAEETLDLARALGERDTDSAESGALPFSLPPGARRATERLLAEERRRRDALLAALLADEGDERALPPEAVAALRPIELPDPPPPGLPLARARAEGPVDARALYGPDGRRLAVYYLPRGEERPLLREEDTDADGRPDTWSAYRDGLRSDRWEARGGGGWPDLHLEFAPDGRVARVALDEDADRHPERVFDYADGALVSEARDTDGDDVLDRFETFAPSGRVRTRGEDLDGDGRVDVRSHFRNGRLVSREIEDPAVVEALLAP